MATYKATYKTEDDFMKAFENANAKPVAPVTGSPFYYAGKTPQGNDTVFIVDTAGKKPVYMQTCNM